MSEKNTNRNNPLWDSEKTIEERLDYLVNALTLEEKFSCLGTGNPAIERLGIPAFFVGCEGAHGLQMRHDQSFDKGEPQPTTIFPNPVGMSASWDTELIRQAGEIVGTEARAVFEKEGRRGGLCLWAPTIDMERDPRWGRTEEAYGEDPYLTGKMASAYIQGMRGDGEHIRCGATLKHFYANNVEDGRVWKSSSIDPRNKYEYYLEPFCRAVVEGGAEAMMTSYNEINGVPAILNHEVQKLAKEQWGIHHVVCDGGDMKQTVDCHHYFGSHTETIAEGLKAGIDCFTDDIDAVMEGAREAYELGMIDMNDIDRALKCHFSTLFRLGLFDEQEEKEYGLNLPEYQQTARELTGESVVLLKNDALEGQKLLPLSAEHFTADKKLAVIGPSAGEWFMDWYSGIPPYSVTPLEGIRAAMGGMDHIIFESGVPEIKLACGDKYIGILEDGKTIGLVDEAHAEIFESVLWDREQMTLKAKSNGMLLTTQDGCDEDKVYRGGTITATAKAAFGWFVKEVFHAQVNLTDLKESEEKSLSLSVDSRFPEILRNGEEMVLRAWNKGALFVDEQNRIRVQDDNGFAEDGEVCRIVSYTDTHGHQHMFGDADFDGRRNGTYETITGSRYRSLPPICPVLVKDGIRSAKDAAAKADTVIYVGGAHPMITCKEEVDRKDIAFPPYQRTLVQELYQANPRLIAALVTSVPYAIGWEKQNIPAILVTAGGSMELGNGLADVLFGKKAPAGRLNMTWYRDDSQLPDMDDYDIIQKERTYQYFKGDVLYPFGHGLTYAQTEICDLTAETSEDGQTVHVECTVRNMGQDKAVQVQDEVVQIYFAKKASAVKRPIRTLAAFARVKALAPQEERRVSFEVPVEQLRYYDTVQRKMLLEPGSYELQAGHSSAQIDCVAEITLQGQERGVRDGAAWQPADHYDRSRNGYLWEGHMGYDSVAHKADTHVPEDLFEKVGGLWQNINEVTRTEDAGERQDDCLILEYDSVYIPEGADCLVIDADALAQSTMDVYLDGVHHASFIVPEFDDLSGAGDNPGWAAAATAKNAPHGRGFRHLSIPLEDLGKAGSETVLRLRCQGDVRICRWRFEKAS